MTAPRVVEPCQWIENLSDAELVFWLDKLARMALDVKVTGLDADNCLTLFALIYDERIKRRAK